MNEIEFRQWLSKKDISKKMQSDFISRLKRLEREIGNCDIDEQYRSNKCQYLLSLFSNKGINEDMDKYQNIDLPIGKYHLSTYKYALTRYIQFLEDRLTLVHE